jgi:hypothetical protein
MLNLPGAAGNSAAPAISRRFADSYSKRRTTMNQDNRVLSRAGARDLTEQEVMAVAGTFRAHTLSPCVIDRNGNLLNGDTQIGECGG